MYVDGIFWFYECYKFCARGGKSLCEEKGDAKQSATEVKVQMVVSPLQNEGVLLKCHVSIFMQYLFSSLTQTQHRNSKEKATCIRI